MGERLLQHLQVYSGPIIFKFFKNSIILVSQDPCRIFKLLVDWRYNRLLDKKSERKVIEI